MLCLKRNNALWQRNRVIAHQSKANKVGQIIFVNSIYLSIFWESKLVKQDFLRKTNRQLCKPLNETKTYSQPCQIYEVERFGKLMNGVLPRTIFSICSVLDVWQGSECASAKVWKLLFTVCFSHERKWR